MRTSDDARSIETSARAALAGSRAAFGVLVDRFEEPLFRYLRVRTGNRADAEELVQETFLRAWDRLQSYDPRLPFRSWLFTIAVRAAISRSRRPREFEGADEALEGAEALDARTRAVDDRDEERNLWRIAERVLGPEQRGALWLRYAEDLTPEEVARVLGKRVVTTRVLLHRARKRLVDHLGSLERARVDLASAGAPLPRLTRAGGPS